MKIIALFSLLFSLSAFSGDELIQIKTQGITCGEAGVKSFEVCEKKASQDGYRIMDVKVQFESEQIIQSNLCEVTSQCSFYQIID